MNYKDIVYEHLGHPKFNREDFIPVSNIGGWIKPRGGLWASPENSKDGWRSWVDINEFMQDKYCSSYFRFKLKEDSRLFVVDNTKCLSKDLLRDDEVELGKIIDVKLLDFNKLVKLYDAVLVLISKDGRLYWDLYGWDCDSLLVLNPDVVVEL